MYGKYGMILTYEICHETNTDICHGTNTNICHNTNVKKTYVMTLMQKACAMALTETYDISKILPVFMLNFHSMVFV